MWCGSLCVYLFNLWVFFFLLCYHPFLLETRRSLEVLVIGNITIESSFPLEMNRQLNPAKITNLIFSA